MNSLNDSADFSTLLRRQTVESAAPTTDLWMRIQHAHSIRVVRRRHWRGVMVGLVLIAALGLGFARFFAQPGRGPDVDWQARAQVLEMQLHALDRDRAPIADIGVAEAELGDVDRSLQAAYMHVSYTNNIVSLWKRRCELLDALILARKQGLTLSRI